MDVDIKRDESEIREYMTGSKKSSLSDLKPDLAIEWHPTKNGTFRPDQVTLGSSIKVWWKCRVCEYEWQTTVNHRVNGTGCPACYHKRVQECHPLSKKYINIA